MRFEGKTVDEATAKACLKLEKTLKEISVEVIFEGKKGFLGIGSKPAIIEVKINGEDEKLPEKKDQTKFQQKNENVKESNSNNKIDKSSNKLNSEKKVQVTEVSDNEKQLNAQEKTLEIEKTNYSQQGDIDSNIMEIVEEYLLEFFNKMGIEDVKLTFELDEEYKNINVNIISENSRIIIGKRGVVIDAIQAIINIVFANKRGCYWIKLDSDNYRIKRQKTIESLAFRSAASVKKYKKRIVLDNLTSNERRIIHSVLQKDNRIDTFSEGREPYRKLIISLKRNK